MDLLLQTEVLVNELRIRGLPTWGRKDQVASSELVGCQAFLFAVRTYVCSHFKFLFAEENQRYSCTMFARFLPAWHLRCLGWAGLGLACLP